MIERYSDHSANERTFLAWVRTAVAIVGFCLVVARLSAPPAPLWSEALVLLVGMLVIFLAYLRMRHIRKRIDSDTAMDDEQVPADTLLLLLTTALFILLIAFAVHVG
ncbi:YidH family protein [Roseovarius sp. S1116L3]|uniref:YidH family protein n=1 Tax=Roseovarius roseus TaxID=3342636 RepID=UPI00372AF6ED